ncbi:MAG: Hvo_1808 family surface protein [Halodesulfurarchaeum sp.]|nr:Hvo_1808 family surface protein [Halodesulfurarchaeum sp.]
MRRALAVFAVALLLVGAGCVSAPAPAEPASPVAPETTSPPPGTGTSTTPDGTPAFDPTPTDDPPPEPTTDRLGWEAGYWHNETLAVDPSDGLNRSELEAVVARGQARVEAIRKLEFEDSVEVRIIDRTEWRNQTTGGSDPSDNQTLHQDVKFEALFFIGEGESAIGQQEENRATGVMGYYAPSSHSITIVSDSGPPLQMNEVTLAQELFHAVQEEHFAVSEWHYDTEEARNAALGIIEGDGNYVDYLYEQRYAADLVMPERTGGGGGSGGDRHIGLFALRYQPYSDGPPFVAGIREESGWAGVNAVYENPPESSTQTIHTEKYLLDSPLTVTIEDRSTAAWWVPDQGEGNIDHAAFGEAGLYAMLWYPSYARTAETGTATDVVIPYRHFFQTENEFDAYNYAHPTTTGWKGDKLLPYVREDSPSTDETGYVWKIEWATDADAREFREAYLELLRHHGGTAVEGSESVYRIFEGPFEDGFSIRRQGTTVTIVNAPTVSELDAVRAGAGKSS